MNILKIFLTLFLFVFNIYSQETTTVRYWNSLADTLVKTSLRDSSGYKILEGLCKIGPRLSGSELSLRAIDYCKQTMIRLGYDSVWLQPVMVPRWVRNSKEKAAIFNSAGKKIKELSVASLGGSVGTDGVLSAGVIEVSSFDELKKRAGEVKNRVVFYNIRFEQGVENTFQAYGKPAGYRVRGGVEAAKYGAAGFIIRSIASKNDNVPHVGVTIYHDSLPKIPALAIGIQDADFLSASIKKNPGLKIKIEMNCFNDGEVESYNVIGEIKGSHFPDEVITVSGHIDSWDKGTGAHDDGAGCIQSVEIPDLLRRAGFIPKRSIRCVLFMNEENGSRGADSYAKSILNDGKKHIMAMESDRGAFTPRGFTIEKDSAVILKLKDYSSALRKTGIDWIEIGGSGADISHMKNVGVLMGYVPDSQRYFDYHHSANDDFSEVHPREFELGTAAMALMSAIFDREF